PADQRAALVTSLLRDEWVARRYPDTGTGGPNLPTALITRARVFTIAEFATVWKAIAEARPRNGRTAAESADLFAQNNKLPEALAAFDLAAAQTEANYSASAGFRCRKAELLERTNCKDEARTFL